MVGHKTPQGAQCLETMYNTHPVTTEYTLLIMPGQLSIPYLPFLHPLSPKALAWYFYDLFFSFCHPPADQVPVVITMCLFS